MDVVVGEGFWTELIEGGVFNDKMVLLALLILLWLSAGHKQQAGDRRYQRRANSACFLLI